MKLIKTLDSQNGNSKTFLLGYPSTSPFTGTEDLSRREGLLALIWQGGENAISKVHNGNDQPQGFGHICKLIRLVSMVEITDFAKVLLSIILMQRVHGWKD
jgi:lactoylglutathione lyase